MKMGKVLLSIFMFGGSICCSSAFSSVLLHLKGKVYSVDSATVGVQHGTNVYFIKRTCQALRKIKSIKPNSAISFEVSPDDVIKVEKK